MHGAALLYNLMLAEAVPSDQRVDEYERRLAGWHQLLTDREPELRSWDQGAFWRLVDHREARVPIPTRSFSSRWIEMALERLGGRAATGTDAQRDLIRDRERFLKRGRARLIHREYLMMWGGAAGADQLSYRWESAQTIAIDILRALRGAAVDADAA
jgi:hypothetical protein